MQLKHTGNVVPFKPRSIHERTLGMTSEPQGPNGCRVWTESYRQDKGRPQMRGIHPRTGKSTMLDPNRALLEETIGRTLEPHEQACHKRGCLPGCVTQGHAYVGNAKMNAADAMAEGRMVGRKMTARKACNLVKTYRMYRERGKTTNWIVALLMKRYDLSNKAVGFIIRGRTWADATGIVYEQRQPGRPKKKVVTQRTVKFPAAAREDRISA